LVTAALAGCVSTPPRKGSGPPLQGGNKPACMALSVKPVAPDSTRSALHVGMKNDSARDEVVKKYLKRLASPEESSSVEIVCFSKATISQC
jgi:hypothetical protein